MDKVVIFSNAGKRTMVSRAQYIAVTVLCSLMLLILIFLLPNVEDQKGRIFVGAGILFLIIGLIVIVPWIPRFKKNVTATSDGISYEDHFFSWAEVTKLNTWYAGRIDVYVSNGSRSEVFCFGIVLNADEFRESYEHMYSLLTDARKAYRAKSGMAE